MVVASSEAAAAHPGPSWNGGRCVEAMQEQRRREVLH